MKSRDGKSQREEKNRRAKKGREKSRREKEKESEERGYRCANKKGKSRNTVSVQSVNRNKNIHSKPSMVII